MMAAVGCLVCLLLTLVLLVLGLPFIISFLVYHSPLTTEGTVTDIKQLPASNKGGVEARVRLHWTLDIPLLGDVTLTTQGHGEWGKDVDVMDTEADIPNPSFSPMLVHAMNATVTAREEFGELWTEDVKVKPWGGNTKFKTWSRVSNMEHAREVADRLGTLEGGMVTLRLNPQVTLLSFWNIDLDIAKVLKCNVAPFATEKTTPKPDVVFLSSLSRRGSVARSLVPAGEDRASGAHINFWNPKHQNVKVKCSYVGNAN